MAYHSGLIAGILCGVAVGVILVALLFKKKVLDLHFDERQELARGKAFQYGFFTILVCLYIYAISDLWRHWCDALAGVTICAVVGMGVFAITCILKDAYLSLREKPRQIMAMFAFLSFINLGFGVMYLYSGDLVEDGVLTFRAVNPIIGGMTLLILIVYIVSYLFREREEE